MLFILRRIKKLSVFKEEFYPESGEEQKQLWLYPVAFCLGINPHIKDKGFGPFRNGFCRNEQTGTTGTFLIEASEYSLEDCLLLENQHLNLELRSNGPKLKSLKLQSKEVIKLLEEHRFSSELTEFPQDNNQDPLASEELLSKDEGGHFFRDSVDTADNKYNNTFADKVELTAKDVDKKFSKSDLIAHTLVNHFLNSSNLPFFNHGN